MQNGRKVEVTLEERDVNLIYDTANRQYQKAVIGGNKNRHGLPQNQGMAKDVELAARGLAGEVAFCKAFGFPWNPWLEKDADVGRAIEIRTTHYPHGRLIWRPSTDKTIHAYVLIKSHLAPKMEICGWTTGTNAKMVGFFGDYCRMVFRKAREEVYWVEEKDLSLDWQTLERFYYAPTREN